MSGSSLRCDAQKTSWLDSEIVEVKVASTGQIFKVHESLLRATSKFFIAALSKEWPENQNKLVELPEDDADTVKAYVHWLYTGRIATDKDEWHDFDAQAGLFVLGEKLIDARIQNDVIDTMLACARSANMWPTDVTLNIIYEGTPKSSPLRRLMVDIHIALGKSHWLLELGW